LAEMVGRESSAGETQRLTAMEKSLHLGDEIPIGKFFERTDLPALHAAEPVLDADLLVHSADRVPPDVVRSLIQELM